MINTDPPCRTYIVYENGLFAQGVRSVLEEQCAMTVVGMESDVAKALKAVRSLQPEVIIVEECTGAHQRMRLGALLHSAAAGRVVTLSLDHAFATVYQRNRIPATNLGELVRVVKGLDSGFGGDDDRADREPRVRGTRVPMVSGAKVRMLPEANEIHTPGAPGKEATGTGRASSRGKDGRTVRMNPKENIDG